MSSSVFTAVDVAYCSSLQALQQAYDHGLDTETRIRTSAPALLMSKINAVENIEANLDRTRWKLFFDSTFDFVRKLHSAVAAKPHLSRFALSATRQGVEIQRQILNLAFLDTADFENPRAVIDAATGDISMDQRVNGSWPELLSSNPRLVHVRYDVALTRERAAKGGDAAPFLKRMKFAGLESIGYRLFMILWSRMRSISGRGEVLIYTEGELVKEAAFNLALRGYALRKLERTGLRFEPPPTTIVDEILAVAGPVIEERVLSIAAPQALASAIRVYRKALENELGRQISSSTFWRERIGEKVKAILVGYPWGGETIALAEVCEEKGLPFVAFQHGIDREITAAQDSNQANYENSVTPYFFTYNETGARLSRANPFARSGGRVEAVGLSTDHCRVHRGSSSRDILYVSTALYRGFIQRRLDSVTDLDMAQEEIALIQNVLSKISRAVDFKPYPSIRFIDPDPVLAEVRSSPNMRLVGQHIDLRYIVADYRLIITSRATSTVGWCIMSERPLVFIERPYWFALRPEARKAFSEATFLFDPEETDWLMRLREFLSQPLDQIEQAWRMKAPARQRLIETFFTRHRQRAGARAADAIHDICIGA